MDKKTVFVKTDAGESEVSGKSDALYGDAKRILLLVDDESTVGEISKRAPPSLREALNNVLQELVDGGYIRDMRAPVNVPQKPALKMATPAFKMATPKAAPPSSIGSSAAAAPPSQVTPNAAAAPSRASSHAAVPPMAMPDMMMPTMPKPDITKEEPAKANMGSDLDFSFITSGPSHNEDEAKAAKDRAQAEAVAKVRQAEQLAQAEAAAKAAKLKAYEDAKEKAKIEVAMKARIEAEARGKNEAEAARLKAEQEALKVRAELEATKARVEAEVRARIEAEARVKQEVEAAKAKAETEMRNRIEAEARAKAETEARIKREAEAERLRIEKERAELEIARVKAEAEIKMRAEAELRVRAEVEARMKREAEAERLRIEKERAELELARVKAEAEIKMRTEAELRVRAEVEARLKAEELAKQADLRGQHPGALSDAGANGLTEKGAQIDPAEKLRQSFVESFGHDKGKPKTGPLNFKLDTFSLADTGKMPAATLGQQAAAPASGGSKVKAAIEQRAQKEAEALRLKAEQEAAQLKAQQDEAARIKAEQESIRLKAEHDAYRLKIAQEEAQAKAEAETRKLSDQQAKQWEEAQRRAATQAQAEKERQAQEAVEAKAKSRQKPARSPRKPLPIGKIVSSLVVLAIIAVAGLPYLWPLDEYIAPLEKEISIQLNQPVKIMKINLALLPLPKLELHNVTVGKGQELTVGDAELNFDFSALFAPTKSINNMKLSNVNLSAASLDTVLVWLQAVGGVERYPVARMELSGVRVNSEEIKLPLFNGNVDFDMQGKFTKADLKSEDAKLELELQSLPNGLQLTLNMHESSLPVLTNYKFNDLSASGFVVNGEFAFSDFFAHIHGGTVTGKGKLSWFNGWKLEGQLNARSLELQSMFPDFGVTGQLYGDVSLSMFGPILSQLDKDPRMEGSFEAKDGVINKLDIDTVARFGTRQGGGGRTSFTELDGTLKADNRGQRFFLNNIAAGSVSGSGLFEVDANHQLTGKLLVDIKGAARGSVPMQLSGSPTEPLLQAGR